MQIDISFLPALGAAFLLTFARVGTMMMMMPGLGESNMSSRVRLTIALALTAVLLPLHQQAYTVTLNTLGPVLLMLVQEIIIGAVLGLTARLALSALQVAGSVIAQQMGLGFVTAVDPTQNQQGLLVGNFLTVLGVAMIFATDMHHLVIKALNDSYLIFAPDYEVVTWTESEREGGVYWGAKLPDSFLNYATPPVPSDPAHAALAAEIPVIDPQ